MFYLEEEIAINLICPRCQTKFVDPRIILPCLETLCANCIGNLTEENNNEISCHFCAGSKHAIPVGGFSSNKIVAKMLNIKANEVNRSPNVEALKQKISQMQKLACKFVFISENAAFVINKYCRSVKSQIDMLVETKKKELDHARDKFATMIDSWETECLEKWQTFDKNMFVENINEINNFIGECSEYLKRFKIDEDVVSEKRREAGTHAADLEKLLSQLKRAQFNGQLLKFKEKELDLNLIGKFEFDKLEMPQKDNGLSKKYFLESQSNSNSFYSI
jgi:hypothetical protein